MLQEEWMNSWDQVSKEILSYLYLKIGNLTQSGRDFNSSNAASLKGKLQSLEVKNN